MQEKYRTSGIIFLDAGVYSHILEELKRKIKNSLMLHIKNIILTKSYFRIYTIQIVISNFMIY